MQSFEFTEEVIQKLFGHEAAEDEVFERLQEYYFKNRVYTQITAELPLRILVGHKGIGKSALFKIAMSEDSKRGYLPILIQPNDISNLKTHGLDFLQSIRDWKNGLIEIISQKILVSFGINDNSNVGVWKEYGGKIVNYLIHTINKQNTINYQASQEIIVNNFSKNNRIIIYIDDLDRGWLSTKEDIARISTLLNAIRDIINENNGTVYFRVALRSDVYFLVRTSDESTDKIEGSVIWYSWTNHEILVMLIKRIETFWGNTIDETKLIKMKQSDLSQYLHAIMEPRFSGLGKWNDAPIYRILMSLIRKRPRDLVKLCTLAARQAYEDNSRIINTIHFKSIFEEYSQGRIQDTINEYKSELPDIERLIMGMRPNRKEKKASQGYVYTTQRLLEKIKNISTSGKFRFANGNEADEKSLANFLYKINFLTARKELDNKEVDRKYFEENRYLSSKFADFGYEWEIHPAYRWALQPDTVSDIFIHLGLTSDDIKY